MRHTVKKSGLGVVLVGWLLMSAGCVSFGPPLKTAGFVDLNKYVGVWYEIARYPNTFQGGCEDTTATYELMDDGRVSVLNRCVKGDYVDTIQGTARVVDPDTNAKLKVQFFWPFEGDYWILAVGDDYQWALVGEPSRSMLWILARQSQISDAEYDSMIGMLPDFGYDADRLIRTPQSER
ncbi:MAG: lipocalin family protein [Phycisphaerales bacterium]|nr:lipocalin family protein [Phycisphaerales bacterium]